MAKKNESILILGSGIAGLSSALKLSDAGFSIKIASKAELIETATRYAQGGIASVWSKDDSFSEHEQDTLEAGAGLCRQEIVKLCVSQGPARVHELIELGVKFTKNQDQSVESFDLHQEGGHHKRRILHSDDLTGLEIEKTLIDQVRKRKNITILEHHIAIDLITESKVLKSLGKISPKNRSSQMDRCLGAYLLDEKTGKIHTETASHVILATGGAGKVYLYTSNPDIATGDGIAMAYRAGARVANLEFMQFHPTCLYHPNAKTFLISEALRGEGAILKTLDQKEFMYKYHPMKSLAPRDVVARAIDMEIKRSGEKHVLLDATHLSEADFKSKFPNIFETCLKFGIHPDKEPIPVVPACHYTCGGVLVDHSGKTSIDHLYAVGEVASTGLHGANRLASNSLLEAVVFAEQVTQHIVQSQKSKTNHDSEKINESHYKNGELMPPSWDEGRAVRLEEKIDIAASWLEVRQLMWNYVGIVRSNQRLERARKRLQLIRFEVLEAYWDYLLTKDLIELRNLVTVAELIVESAISRKESRGLHYTVDYPNPDDANFKHDTIL